MEEFTSSPRERTSEASKSLLEDNKTDHEMNNLGEAITDAAKLEVVTRFLEDPVNAKYDIYKNVEEMMRSQINKAECGEEASLSAKYIYDKLMVGLAGTLNNQELREMSLKIHGHN